jgi:hypothetical protein
VTGPDSEQLSTQLTAENAAIRYLEEAIAGGKDWHIALLEAIALWDVDEETRDGHLYRYVIAGEALDWMVLAERLCAAVGGLLPEDEKLAFLFHGKFPSDVTIERFKELVGSVRYHQYLNYFYGITVEEALFRAVRDEVRKERRVSGFSGEQDPSDEVYRRVYGQSKTALLRDFRKEWGYSHRRSTTLLEMKEFTYWLFKYRLKRSDKARVASDTRKGLDWLSNNGLLGHPVPGRERGE